MDTHRVVSILLAFMLQLLLPSTVLGQPNQRDPDKTALAKAEAEERRIIRDIQTNGVGSRFVISEIAPDPGDACAATITDQGGGLWSMEMELPSDQIPIKNGTPFIWGSDSVHRFSGEVRFDDPKMPLVVGEGGVTKRLTFLLRKGSGYIFVRGKGRVVFPGGRTVQLGRAS